MVYRYSDLAGPELSDPERFNGRMKLTVRGGPCHDERAGASVAAARAVAAAARSSTRSR